MSTLTRIVLSAALLGATGLALASSDPTCDAPKDKWIKLEDFKARLSQEGYKVKSLKETKGHCYEMYGHNQSGQKVEIHFDPATAKVLKSEGDESDKADEDKS